MVTGRIYGYARVSSKEQKLDRQLVQLGKYVPEENILTDKESGKSLDRPAYNALKGQLGLRSGDTLYITSLDRLSRNKEDIKNELMWFQKNNIRLIILDLPTSMIEVPTGQEWILNMVQNVLVEVLASMAEQERLMIRKRQREGIDAAMQAGKKFGRRQVEMPDRFGDVYVQWKQGVITAKRAMEILELKRTTFYRLVKEYESVH